MKKYLITALICAGMSLASGPVSGKNGACGADRLNEAYGDGYQVFAMASDERGTPVLLLVHPDDGELARWKIISGTGSMQCERMGGDQFSTYEFAPPYSGKEVRCARVKLAGERRKSGEMNSFLDQCHKEIPFAFMRRYTEEGSGSNYIMLYVSANGAWSIVETDHNESTLIIYGMNFQQEK